MANSVFDIPSYFVEYMVSGMMLLLDFEMLYRLLPMCKT